MGRLFGTDGIRGIANDGLGCELALKVGRAAAAVLSGSGRRRPVFVVGMDPRLSSDMLMMSLTAGLCSTGADVLLLGTVPTPAVAFLVGKYKADAGVMISASHNSYEYNGIKIFGGAGYKLADELEERIEAIVQDSLYTPKLASEHDIGKVEHMTGAVKDYVDHLKSTVPFNLEGLKVAVDCANGSASATAQKLFSELGAECHLLFCEPDGININDACGSTHTEALARYVVDNGLDAGVAFDGDADRCLCVDENGELVDGDMIMAICALDMKKRGKLSRNTVVGTVMTNLGFIKFCEANGIRFNTTKVGDRYVLEEMLLEEYDFGGEQSGHVVFRDFATTGDGQLTAVQLLSLMRREGKKLSELKQVMHRYPQCMVNVPVSPEGKVNFFTDPVIKDAVAKAKKLLNENDGRIVVRPSGTEPLIRVMTEGLDQALIERVAKDTAAVVNERLQS
jgi:phosphoglucosamine mutase